MTKYACAACGYRVAIATMRISAGGAFCRPCRPYTGEQLEVLARMLKVRNA